MSDIAINKDRIYSSTKCICSDENAVCTSIECKNAARSTYWDLEAVVSNSFNRLKAKLYNLMELSTMTKEQASAAKGLIRGFANEEYRNCQVDMRYYGRLAKFLPEGEDSKSNLPPLGAEPLEVAER